VKKTQLRGHSYSIVRGKIVRLMEKEHCESIYQDTNADQFERKLTRFRRV
jgi:hypothetical protein